MTYNGWYAIKLNQNKPFIALDPLWLGVVAPERISSLRQIDLFKNYSYLICKKNRLLSKNNTKNINMNAQWMRFQNLSAKNSPRRVDMPLESNI